LELAHHILSPQDLTNTISQTYINDTGKTATGFFIENLTNKTNTNLKNVQKTAAAAAAKKSKAKIKLLERERREGAQQSRLQITM
jgi:PBP1b-binding outer membrane lipoprotein LpoB